MKQRRVLIVEPDCILAKAYAAALSDFVVQYVCTAAEAIAAADAKQPDVVVLEPRLARNNGVEFLYEFRSYGEWRDVPVILITSQPDAFLPHTDTFGIVAVLEKSATSLHAVADAVRSALTGSTDE